MSSKILQIDNLYVEVGGRSVIKGASLKVGRGEIVVLRGENGGGKSSLLNTLMGNPDYKVVGGEVTLEGDALLTMEVSERARKGLFVAWQNPVSVPGVKVFSLAKSIQEARGVRIDSLVAFKRELEQMAVKVGLNAQFVSRNVGEGFSGGEKKRLELLWLELSQPKVALLDEIDSGLDEEGREMAIEVVNKLAKRGTAFVIVTHYPEMERRLHTTGVWEIENGNLQPRS